MCHFLSALHALLSEACGLRGPIPRALGFFVVVIIIFFTVLFGQYLRQFTCIVLIFLCSVAYFRPITAVFTFVKLVSMSLFMGSGHAKKKRKLGQELSKVIFFTFVSYHVGHGFCTCTSSNYWLPRVHYSHMRCIPMLGVQIHNWKRTTLVYCLPSRSDRQLLQTELAWNLRPVFFVSGAYPCTVLPRLNFP